MPRIRRSRWRKRISTRSSERRMARGMALIMVAVLAGSVATYFLRRDYSDSGADGTVQKAKAQVEAKPAPPAAPTADDLAAAYFKKLGGQKVMDDLKSLRVLGTLTLGVREYGFEMIKKAPNLVRFRVEDKAGTLMLGSDGTDAWVAYRSAGGPIKTWDADEATRDWLWLQAPLGTWLAHSEATEARFALETPAAEADKTLTPVSVLSPAGRKATYYLSAKELRPERLELLDAQPGAVAEVVDLEDMQFAQNITWLPYKLVVEGPNGPVATLVITQLRFNTGILSATFDRPVADAAGQPASPAAANGAPAFAASQGASGPQGVNVSLKQSFDANPMPVHNFQAQTNMFQTGPLPRIVEEESAPADDRPVLANYGFPWPLPW
jgi:hypothetical protein